jgi:adenine phosphoribosyltransferase
VGEINGILGAKNRLKNAKEGASAEEFDYWISIENYIEPAHEGFWLDRAVVIVQKNGKPAVTELSREVRFEEELAEEARMKTSKDYSHRDTGFSVTAGMIIQMKLAEKGQGVAKDDWHSAYGGVSRKNLIKEALFKALIRSQIDTVVDFKKKGVQFMELSGLMGYPVPYQSIVDAMLAPYRIKGIKIDAIAALESRGWFFGIPMSMKLKVPFYPIRKKGKLAKPTYSLNYQTEYSSDEMEIAVDHLNGKTILIVDDVLATGGSIRAAEELFRRAGAEKIYTTCLVELLGLSGRPTLKSDFTSLLQY